MLSDVERSLLAAIMLNSSLFKQTAALGQDDFLIDSHRRIYARMVDLAESSRPIDMITLIEELERHGELEGVGGVPYVTGLVEGVPDRPSIQHYVKMLRDRAGRRRAAKLVEKAQRLADDPSVPTAALSEIGKDLSDISDVLEPLPPRFSEEALALRFSRRYANR